MIVDKFKHDNNLGVLPSNRAERSRVCSRKGITQSQNTKMTLLRTWSVLFTNLPSSARSGCAVLLVILVGASCTEDREARKARLLEAGTKHLAAGEAREAVIELRNAIEVDPQFGEARAKLAAAYEMTGDGGNALGEFIRAADLLPNDIPVQLAAGRYLLAARRADDALARADGVLKLDPKSIDGHILRGNALGGLNDLDSALAEIEEALQLDPSRGVTYTQLGLVESARGQREAAETAFKRAVELAPAQVGGHLALANFYWASGRLDEAEHALEAALALDPKNEGTNRALAVFSLSSGRIEQAEKYLTRIADLSRAPASIFTLAEYYIATRRSSKAVTLLEPLAGESRVAGAKQRLARAYAAAGENAKAHALIDEILAKTPRDSETLLLKGQLLLDENHRDEALGVVKAAVEADPNAIAAQFTLGKVYAARGDRDGADAAFREVLRQNPSATAARVQLSLLQLANGTVGASLRTAEEAVSKQPGSIDAKLALVRSLLASKELDRASVEIQALLKALPNVAAVHVQAGVLAATRSQVPAARAAFDQALKLDASSLEALAGILALDLNAKDFAAAKNRIDRRLETAPVPAEMLLLAARTYGSMNDMGSAERVLRRAIETDSSLLPAYGMLAQVYFKQQKLDEARKEFDNLAQRQSSPVGALTMSGLILQAQGNTQLAQQRYEQAVSVDPRAVVAANNLAWIYAENGERLQDALRLARSAAEVLPEAPEILDTLGWVYYKSALPVMAIAPLMRAVERNPKNASYQYHLGLAYAKAGDPVRSRASLARALELGRDAAWGEDARRVIAGLDAKASQ